MLRSNAIQEPTTFSVGVLAKVFIKKDKGKRGQWTENRPVFAFDLPKRTDPVPSTKGKKITAVVEEIRPALRNDELETVVQDAIEELDRNLHDAVHQVNSTGDR